MSSINSPIEGLISSSSLQTIDNELVIDNPNDHFLKKDKFVESLFDLVSPFETTTGVNSASVPTDEKEIQAPVYSDTVRFTRWKNILNISARLVEHYDDIVVLECLIDKENGIYEEWEFEKSDFIGYDLSVGSLFYLQYFKRENEKRLEIHNDPGMVHKEDFPKIDFVKLFEKSKLFKK